MRCGACAAKRRGKHDEGCTPEHRFWEKVRVVGACWEWQGSRHPNGYGRFGPGTGKVVQAHRFIAERTWGPIPEGLVVMHSCDNPGCVRPAHLSFGTMLDNMRDMAAKGRARPYIRPRVSHCPQGHQYDEKNTKIGTRGHWSCRACAADRARAKRAKLREAA